MTSAIPVTTTNANINTGPLANVNLPNVTSARASSHLRIDGPGGDFHDSPSKHVKRRHLPIEERKKVFNEWGAVIRQQDEMEQLQ